MIHWVRTHDRILSFLLILALMGMIFYFSSQPALESDATSGHLVALILRIFCPNYEKLEPIKQLQIGHVCSWIVRKSAHLTEYAMLGASLFLHFKAWEKRRVIPSPFLLSYLIGTAYAVSDELHQIAVPGRSGEWSDVLLDSAGILVGILLLSRQKIIRKRKNSVTAKE